MIGENVQDSMFKVNVVAILVSTPQLAGFPGIIFNFKKFIILLSLLLLTD